MRLAIATPFLETYGGMEKVVLRIAKHFNADIYCIRYNPEQTYPEFQDININVKESFIGNLPPRRVSTAIEAGNYFLNLKLDYDLINAHQTPAEWTANNNNVLWYCHSPNREAYDLYEWRMSRRNLISRLAFYPSIQAFKHIEAKLVPKIGTILTNSKNSQSRIKKFLNRDSEILHPAVDNKFRYKDNEQFFFYPSRIAPEKDFEYAITAFAETGKDLAGWKLVIAGAVAPRHEPYLRKLELLAEKLCVPNSVRILPNVSEEQLIDFYSRCHSVLYTSINEDYGLVPLEAMASGKICIAKDEGGAKETIDDGVDGFRERDWFRFKDRLIWATENTEECIRMGKIGQDKVKKHFTWDAFMKKFEEKVKDGMKKLI